MVQIISPVLISKLVFVSSITLLLFFVFAAVYSPPLLFLILTILFVVLMSIRVVSYAKSKNLLFMTGPCYFINIYTLIYIWIFPPQILLFYILFGLANSTVYSGIYLYRNSFAFHHLDKMTSCFIHFLPPLVSYCVRWFPLSSSNWWGRPFVDTHGDRSVGVFNPLGDWIFLVVVPNALFVIHTLLYFVVVHLIIKPPDKYNDSYRYFRAKYKTLWKAYDHISEKFHILVWILINSGVNILLTFLACLAWCSFLFHSIMMIAMVIAMSWFGACYYLDYFALLALKRELRKSQLPKTGKVKSDIEDVGLQDETEDNESQRSDLEIAVAEINPNEGEVF